MRYLVAVRPDIASRFLSRQVGLISLGAGRGARVSSLVGLSGFVYDWLVGRL